MKFLLIVFISVIFAYDEDKVIRRVNLKNVGWKAGKNQFFKGKSDQQIKSLFGWNKASEKPLPGKSMTTTLPLEAIPTEFTAAKQWSTCKTIGTIYNQARCGSCWAFAGVESAMDRWCIQTKGSFNEALSFGQLVECDNMADGCEGGSNYAVWTYMQQSGIVTNACYPYNIPTCPPAQQPCLNFVDTPTCWSNNTCVNGQQWKLYQIGNSYNVDGGVQAMQTEIMTNGPVSACFSVYEDFLAYKSGVYQHTTGSYLGGHCTKIQGWGVDSASGLPYWLVNNQWTTYWGDNGQFKILRGSDECGIEDDVAAGMPAVSNSMNH